MKIERGLVWIDKNCTVILTPIRGRAIFSADVSIAEGEGMVSCSIGADAVRITNVSERCSVLWTVRYDDIPNYGESPLQSLIDHFPEVPQSDVMQFYDLVVVPPKTIDPPPVKIGVAGQRKLRIEE